MRNVKITLILVLVVLCSVCKAEEVSKRYDVSSGYVLARNWAWGYQEEYYYLSGEFHFTYDIPSSAEFDWVEVELDPGISYCEDGMQSTSSLDTLFHMTELELVDANEMVINFIYDKNNPTFPTSDVNLTVTFQGDDLLLTGWFTDDCYDGWQYDLYAIGTQRYSGGTGSPNDPYLIATPNDLNDIGNHIEDFNKHFIMVNDINMAEFTGTQFNIIGHFLKPFTGVFDGNGHVVNRFNWSISTSYDDCIGMFGVVDGPSIIRNVTITEVDINALPSSDFVGALVGYNDGGLILNCSVSGTILGSGNLGGLVGFNDSGNIVCCDSAVEVSGDRYGIGGLIGIEYGGAEIAFCSVSGNFSGQGDLVGGLIGSADETHIYNCFVTGNVMSTGYNTGGLVGDSWDCAVENCYVKGNVSGNEEVGGLFGNYWASTTRISNSYATGKITGNNYVGAFIGYGYYSINCHACFWDSDINPDVNGIGNVNDPNVVGLPTAEMQKRSTFADAGWDMVEVWDIGDNQTYPFLRRHLPSDINKDGETNFYDLAILAEHWLEEY